MLNRQIVFTAQNTVEFLENNVDSAPAGGVLVKLERSTISSGTERANLIGDRNLSATEAACDAVYPKHTGYSSSGVVTEVGDGVDTVKVGDRVALSWSTHSEFNRIGISNVHKIPYDNVSYAAAALCHIGCFPMAAIRKCALEIGESAIVMGQGILGLMAIIQLRAAGAAPLIAADPIPEKRALALTLGADYALDPFDPDFAKQVKKITNGGVNVAIEVTGVGKALNTVLDCMAKFGRVALLGCTRNSDFTIDYYRKVHAPGINLIGAHTIARPAVESSKGLWTTHDDIMAQFKLLSLGRLDYDRLINEVHSPAKAPEVYARLISEKSFPIVQFDWSKL